MDSLTITQVITSIFVATVGIQLTVGGVISRVLWSRFRLFKESYELQIGYLSGHLDRAETRATHAEARLDACMDDLDSCRERVHDLHEGIRG